MFGLLSMSVFVKANVVPVFCESKTHPIHGGFSQLFQVGVVAVTFGGSKKPGDVMMRFFAMRHRAGVSWHLMVYIFMFLEKFHKSKSVVFVDVKNQSCGVKQSCGGC